MTSKNPGRSVHIVLRGGYEIQGIHKSIREHLIGNGADVVSVGTTACCATCGGSGKTPIYPKGSCIVTEHRECADCKGEGR